MKKLVLGSLSFLLLSATAGISAAQAAPQEAENRTKQHRFFDPYLEESVYRGADYNELYDSNDNGGYERDANYSGSRIDDLNNNQRNYDADDDYNRDMYNNDGVNNRPDMYDYNNDNYSGSRIYYFRNDANTSNDRFYSDNDYDPGAFTLVSLAYRGRYEDYGIPGYMNFLESYRSGEVDAEDIVAAGVQTGELSPMVLDDDNFINAVELQVESLMVGR
jgi:hypothetical protein